MGSYVYLFTGISIIGSGVCVPFTGMIVSLVELCVWTFHWHIIGSCMCVPFTGMIITGRTLCVDLSLAHHWQLHVCAFHWHNCHW